MLTGPLVFDTSPLGRRPGTERTIETTIDAPAELGLNMFGVPEGSPMALELRLECVMDGVLATGSVSTRVVGECVRCLTDIEEDFDVDFQELYVYNVESEDDLTLEDEQLDLEPVLRDAVVLALPHNPLCDPDCPGLCPDCGARLADDPDHTHGEAIDPRWAALRQMTDETQE